MKPITEYQVIDHGVENEQYFQGCGLAFTTFDDVQTGIGGSAYLALDDALDCLASNGWDTSSVKNELSKVETVGEDDADCYHYVSVRVK